MCTRCRSGRQIFGQLPNLGSVASLVVSSPARFPTKPNKDCYRTRVPGQGQVSKASWFIEYHDPIVRQATVIAMYERKWLVMMYNYMFSIFLDVPPYVQAPTLFGTFFYWIDYALPHTNIYEYKCIILGIPHCTIILLKSNQRHFNHSRWLQKGNQCKKGHMESSSNIQKLQCAGIVRKSPRECARDWEFQ